MACASGCMWSGKRQESGAYSVAVLGDTHYDAEPESVYHSHYDEYGVRWLAKHTGEKLADYKSELEFFRPGLKEYFFNLGAGHYRLDVSDDAVTMAFYPGDAKAPARTFDLSSRI